MGRPPKSNSGSGGISPRVMSEGGLGSGGGGGGTKKPPAVRLREGTAIRLVWPRDGQWYCGRVKKFDAKKALHTIVYDFGDTRRVDLRVTKWEVIDIGGENYRGENHGGMGERGWMRAASPWEGDSGEEDGAWYPPDMVKKKGSKEGHDCGKIFPGNWMERKKTTWPGEGGSDSESDGDGEVTRADYEEEEEEEEEDARNRRKTEEVSDEDFYGEETIEIEKGGWRRKRGGGERGGLKRSRSKSESLWDYKDVAGLRQEGNGHGEVSDKEIEEKDGGGGDAAELGVKELGQHRWSGTTSPISLPKETEAKMPAIVICNEVNGSLPRLAETNKEHAVKMNPIKREATLVSATIVRPTLGKTSTAKGTRAIGKADFGGVVKVKRPVGRPPKIKRGAAARKAAHDRLAQVVGDSTLAFIEATVGDEEVDEWSLIFAVAKRLRAERVQERAEVPIWAEEEISEEKRVGELSGGEEDTCAVMVEVEQEEGEICGGERMEKVAEQRFEWRENEEPSQIEGGGEVRADGNEDVASSGISEGDEGTPFSMATPCPS